MRFEKFAASIAGCYRCVAHSKKACRQIVKQANTQNGAVKPKWSKDDDV